MIVYYVITAVFMLLSWWAGNRLKSKFQEYSQQPMRTGLTGRQVAELMLKENGINDVKVISVAGQLTDHYNPANKTVNLSEWVYEQPTVAAAAVAAHECGHAVQHANAYTWLGFRSKMVPALNISSKITPWILMIGLGMATQGSPMVLLIGILLFGLTTLFTVITLPVEFDASARALAWLKTANITTPQEQSQASSALRWAASTYVIAALASLGQLLYYVMRYMSATNRN